MKQTPLAAFIDYVTSLQSLSKGEIETLLSHVELAPVKKGDFFLQEGKICRKGAFIAEGVMRYCDFRDGDDITCYFISERQFAIDVESFQTGRPSGLNIQAVTDCVLVTISREADESLSKVLPRWSHITQRIMTIEMMDKANQRSFLINQDARARYEHFVEHYSHLLLRVPLGQIASYLGMTQQSLSRLRKSVRIP